MPVALTPKQWITVLLVNIVVSAVTTLIVVRVLVNQASTHPTSAAPPIAVTDTTQPLSSVDNAQGTVAPSDTPVVTSANSVQTKPATSITVTLAPAKASTIVTSTAPASAGNVRIGRVLFPGQRQRETVVIANDSNTDVVLKGWVLTSSRNVTYTFGNVTLFRNNFINLHTTNGTDVPTDLFWNKSDPAWQVGDVLTLTNNGQVITTYTVTNR